MPIAFDPPQARFDRQQGAGHPAVLLIGCTPAVRALGQLPDLRQERLQAIGGLETHVQDAKHSQPMQRQGFLQAFLQTRGGGAVDRPQLLPEPVQGGPGLWLRRPPVGLLQPPAPEGVV